jgi:Flp pilus assembly protein TadG
VKVLPATTAHGPALQRGAATAEFVIGTPILLFVLYCVVEFGRAFVQYSLLADAVRDADRFLAAKAISDSTGLVNISGTVSGQTQNLVVYGNAAGTGSPLLSNLTTSQVTVSSDTNNNVSVTVVYPYQSLFGGSIPYFYKSGSTSAGSFNFNVYTSMRAL